VTRTRSARNLFAVQRQFGVGAVIACLRVGRERLGAGRRPATGRPVTRAAASTSACSDKRRSSSEAAATWGVNTRSFSGASQKPADHAAHEVNALGVGDERVVFRPGIVDAERGAWLQGTAAMRGLRSEMRRHVRAVEQALTGIGIAELPIEAQIAWRRAQTEQHSFLAPRRPAVARILRR